MKIKNIGEYHTWLIKSVFRTIAKVVINHLESKFLRRIAGTIKDIPLVEAELGRINPKESFRRNTGKKPQ